MSEHDDKVWGVEISTAPGIGELDPNQMCFDDMLAEPTTPGDPSTMRIMAEVAKVKVEISEIEERLKSKKAFYQDLCNKLLSTMDLIGLDSMRGHGFLFYKEHKTSVQTPKDTQDKQALFDYLHVRGIFLETVSVNSQTLNALYKSLAEEAAKDGVLEFKMPGVGEPTTYVNLKLRKG